MSTSKKWTYTTGGFPQCLHQTTYTPSPTSTLTPTQIQIRTKAFAINPVDVQATNLHKDSLSPASPYPWPLSILTTPSPPSTTTQAHETCCDFSGTITHAGASTGFTPGDAVFGLTLAPATGLGTAASILTLDTAHPNMAIARKPAAWDDAHAASLPLVWLTARTSVEAVCAAVEKQAQERRWLVVLGGSSATGMYTVRIAKARGWRVLATCSGRNAEFVRGQLGADEVVDYTAVETSVPREILKRLEGGPVGRGGGVVVVDCVGGTECLDDAELGPKITRYVTIVGDKTSRSDMGGPAIYAQYPRMLMRWALGQVGLWVHYDCVILEAKKEWLEEAGQTLAEHEIVVDSTFKFDELPKALEKMVEGKVRGKLVGVLG